MQMQLQRELEEARKKVRSLEEERDGLQQDVEALCLQSQGSSMFSHSRVLAERVAAAEKELKETRGKIRVLTDEQHAMGQELSLARGGRQSAESALAAERERVLQLETEKEFHQANSARSLAAKDSIAAELEEVRRRLASTGMALGVAEGRADSEERGKHAAEATLAKRQQQLAQTRQELEAKTAEAASLNRQLHGSMEEVKQLEAKNTKLQNKLGLSCEDLDRTKQQLQQLRESEGLLRVQLQEVAATNAQLQGTVSGQHDKLVEVESALATLRSEASQREKAAAALEADLRAQLKEAEETVDEQALELRQQAFELDAQQHLVHRLQQESHHKEVAHSQAAEASRAASAALALTVGLGEREAPAEGAEAAAAGGAGPQGPGQDGDGAGQHSAVAGGGEGGGLQGAGTAHGRHHHHDDAERSEQLDILNRMVKEMKIKLAQATQEKVDALLMVAQTQNQQQQQQQQQANANVGSLASSLNLDSTYASAGRGIASYMSSRFAGLVKGATGSSHASQQPTPSTSPPSGQHAASTGSSAKQGDGKQRVGGYAGVQDGEHAGAVGSKPGRMPDQSELSGQDQLGHGGLGGRGNAQLKQQPHLHKLGATWQQEMGPNRRQSGGCEQQHPQHGPAGGGVGSAELAAALQAQHRAVLASVEAACKYEVQLRAAARALFSQAPEALGQKWTVLTELSKLHEQLNRTRARMGLPAPEPLTSDESAAPGAQAQQGQALQKLSLEDRVTAELLDLVDFGLATLEAYNRMEAMSMICPPTAG